MWYVGAFNNLVNFDYLKRVYICRKAEFEFLGDLGLREFVICGVDAGNEKPTILKSFDTYSEAELELIHILKMANNQ